MPEQCPCPCANPAALGAGPAPALLDLTCADFDKAYAEKIYQQNDLIIALATEGIERGVDKNIRDISGEIRTERTKENIKLSTWYAQMTGCNIPVSFDRSQCVSNSLSEAIGNCFDTVYAETMICALEQARAAHELAMDRATIPDMRNQAKIAARETSNEIFRLRRWLDQKGKR